MKKIFISYSHNENDVPLLNELKKHLDSLRGKVEVWVDDKIPAGGDWDKFIHQELNTSDIILLLVSSDFIASDYVNQVEVPQALARRTAGQCEVVPILLRSCYFKDQPYAHLEMLPKMPDDQKLTPIETWKHRDDAFTSVTERLAKLIKKPAAPTASPGVGAEKITETWASFFKKYPLKPEAPLVMKVNCNRKTHFSEGIYQDFLKFRKERKSLAYFIAACEHQRPESLAKRLVYELLAKNQKIAHPRPAANNSPEVAEIELKIGLEVEDTWAELWKTVQQQLNAQADKPDILATQTHCQSHHWIALIFKVPESRWAEPKLQEHLAYILAQFDDLPDDSRKFLLFFSFEFHRLESLRQAHCTDYLEQLKTLVDGVNKNTTAIRVAHFQCLPPVASDDVVVWFNDRIQTTSPEAQKALLATLKAQLDSEDQKRYDSEKIFDMQKVELMQAAAYDFLHQPQPDLF